MSSVLIKAQNKYKTSIWICSLAILGVLSGCVLSKNDDRKGERFIKIVGIAQEDRFGAVVADKDDTTSLFYLENLDHWPADHHGKQVKVKGYLITIALKRDTTLKVFDHKNFKPVRMVCNFKYKLVD